MTGYITKYALTRGVIETELRRNERHPSMVNAPILGENAYYHGEGRDWHRTKEVAIARAEAMRSKKMADLRKQLKKLETMTISIVRK